MRDTTLVSVIIPCFRQAEFLTEAVDSCLRQTHPNVEIIVVNDGSDDDTEAVAKGYGDRINYIYRVNGGLPAARNTGLRRARGTYIKFLDADDCLNDRQLEWQLASMRGRQDCMVLSAVRLFQHNQPTEFVDHVPMARSLLPDLFQDLDWGGIHGFLFPQALVRAVGGFDEELRCAEDWDLLCRIGMLKPRLLTDARIGAYYRRRPGTMSTDGLNMAETVARLLVRMHEGFVAERQQEWLGPALLGAEHRTYRRLLERGSSDEALRQRLLSCIKELKRDHGPVAVTGSTRYLAAVIGYSNAERLRAAVVRRRAVRASGQ